MASKDVKLPENTLGYSYNRGGLNNQKLALFGLFLKAFREGPKRVVLPDFILFDVVSFNHKRIPIDQALQSGPLSDFAGRHGIEILDVSPRGDEGGWDYFAYGNHFIPRAALLNELTPDSFACDFLRSFIPNAKVSDVWHRIAEAAFGQQGIRLVAQLRIERDWIHHTAHRLPPQINVSAEDNLPSFRDIIAKISNTLSDVPSIYVVCDEANLPVSKDEIRRVVKQEFKIDLFWKSDFLSKAELNELSLLNLSMIDFEMAIAAESFVGITRSTFSNMAALDKYARTRIPVKHHYIYNVLGPTVALRKDNGVFSVPELAIAADPWNTAFDFHLAQIFQSAGDPRRALEHYAAWAASAAADPEEIFVSLYRSAQIKEQLRHPHQEVIDAYLKAAEALPTRAEALHGASRYCRINNMFQKGYEIASRGIDLAAPASGLFVEHWIYEWALLDEYAINASHSGHHLECARACLTILARDKLPANQRRRIMRNAQSGFDQLNAHEAKQSGSDAQAPSDIADPADLLTRARASQEAGRFAEAAALFKERAAIAGDEEEIWYARWQEARCLLRLGDEGGFLSAALDAFNRRPRRAEPLFDLARYYRKRGMNAASVVFSEQGLAMGNPEAGWRFVEDYIYTTGLKEEFSIAANYASDPLRKARGFAACNWLALNQNILAAPRGLARSNLLFYCRAAGALMPSFTARPVSFQAPDGCRLLPPSVALFGDQIIMIQGTASDSTSANRNFLLRMNDELDVLKSQEILPPVSGLTAGLEEPRLFAWREALWCSWLARPSTPEGGCDHALVRVEYDSKHLCRFADLRAFPPGSPWQGEKNWLPRIAGDRLCFIRSCDPTVVLDEQGQTIIDAKPPIAAEHFDGASQAIAFDLGWLAVIREAKRWHRKRLYTHRFVWFDGANFLRRVSRPFFLHNQGMETAAGLTWHPDACRLIISYRAGDSGAWIATIEAEDVRRILDDAEQLPEDVPSGKHRICPQPELLRLNITPASAATNSKQEAVPSPSASIRTPPRREQINVAMRGGLGDVLMCTPGLRTLKQADPECRIKFYAHYAEAVTGLSYIDEVHPLGDAPANAIFGGHGSGPPYSHIAQVIGDLLGVRVRDVRPDCVIQPERVQRFRESWRNLPRPHIVISRRAGYFTRNRDWLEVHWRELINVLTVDASVIEIGLGVQSTVVPDQNYINLLGSSLADLIAAIAAADIYIGPDSGPMHVAAAARKPSVVIAGGYLHPRVTNYPGNIAFYTPVPCAPCRLREDCPHDRMCLDVISPALVEKALWDIWANRAKTPDLDQAAPSTA